MCAAALAIGVLGAEPTRFDATLKSAERMPRLHSLLASQHGNVILERYFHGTRPTSYQNVKSASKSVISALVGIAIDKGLIAGVQSPIAPFFPELNAPKADASKRKITIEDLLTMRSGLESTSRVNYGAWVRSSDWVTFALNRRLLAKPGEHMDYSTGNTHLLSAILTKAAHKDTWAFAQDTLAKPLGFSLAQWPRDPQGIYFGGNDMLLTPRQMLAFGELYLHHGAAGGKQLVPTSWVDTSFVPRTESPFSGKSYGYGWWMDELAGQQTYYAWGFGGQYIFVVPSLDLVVVTTSSVTLGEDRREHRNAVHDLVEHGVIGVIAEEAGGLKARAD